MHAEKSHESLAEEFLQLSHYTERVCEGICLTLKIRLTSLLVLPRLNKHLLDSLVVECWHRVREVPGSIPSQGPRHTKDVIKWYQ